MLSDLVWPCTWDEPLPPRFLDAACMMPRRSSVNLGLPEDRAGLRSSFQRWGLTRGKEVLQSHVKAHSSAALEARGPMPHVHHAAEGDGHRDGEPALRGFWFRVQGSNPKNPKILIPKP